ncbi:signal peptidase II [Sporosalibacterium faouarense]|uniref:signal peptidase II n=1 Tax=Sporosalibacterium faouarense TaxID=516123 RepID=UPI00192BD669|nr:signal peptidase II [Sporosalibacterium faouarense]
MIYIIIPILLVAIDQTSKYLAVNYLKSIGSIELIEGVFNVTYAINTGAAFSILSGKQVFLILVTTAVTGFLMYYLFKAIKENKSRILKLSLSLIIGGALGNLIDRIRLNYVIDYFDFTLINYPIFNVADVFVVCGTILLAYGILFRKDII